MFLDTPTLDVVEKIVHVIGIPAIFGAIVWLVQTFTQFNDRTKNTEQLAADVKKTTDLIATNHLAHVSSGIEGLAKISEKQNEILVSIDKGITVLVDRNR